MCKISVRIIPNSSRTEIVSFSDGVLKVKVMEPADDNRANDALLKFLSKKTKIKSVKIISGLHARNKIIDFGSDFSIEDITNNLLKE